MPNREPAKVSRPPWRAGQAFQAIPVVLIVVIVAVDYVLPSGVHLGPLLAVPPAITALVGGPRITGAVAVLSLVALIFAGRLRGGLATLNHEMQLLSLLLLNAFVVGFCLLRERHQRELAQVRSVSEAAQRVVLRPLPARIGPLQLASVYVAAAAEARIGGDLYAAARTAHATRLLVGDVRGKGLTSISEASLLLCAFREAAHRITALPGLVTHLEASVSRNVAELGETEQHVGEFFVTAALAEVPDDEAVVRLVACGHPPPLLLRGGQVRTLQPPRPAPPLGLGDLSEAGYSMETFPFAAGDLLVLYTDGVIEARDRHGVFYPLAERLRHRRDSDPESLVRFIRDDLIAYVGGRLGDDAAVIVAERGP